MNRKILFATIALVMGAAAMPAAAASFADGSFEGQGASVSSYCYFGSDCPSGVWSGTGAGLQDESNGAWPGEPTPDGSKYGFVQSLGTLQQTFTADTSGLFKLSWLDAGRPNFGSCCQGNQSYDVFLNGSLIASAATTNDQMFTGRQSSAFQLTSGQNYTLAFVGKSANDNTAFIDGVSFGAAVPEPATWALMIGGFGGAGAMLRRRRAALA